MDGAAQALQGCIHGRPPQWFAVTSALLVQPPASQLGYCTVNIFGIAYIWNIEYMVLPDDESFVSLYGEFCAVFDG